MFEVLKNKILSIFDAKALVLVVIIIGLFAPIQFSKAMEVQTIDSDGDGIVDMQEYAAGTNVLQQDTDNDGLSDAQEVFDFLTDPVVPTTSLFSGKENLRFLTPLPGDTVRGQVLFLKGISRYASTDVLFEIMHHGVVHTKEVTTDAKGLFQFEYPLVEACSSQEGFDLDIMVASEKLLSVRVTCEDVSSLSVLTDAKLDGRNVAELISSSETLVVPYGAGPVFYGHADRKYFAVGSFQSTLFSLGMLVDDPSVPIIFRPYMKLEEGKHSFTLVMRDTKKNEVYAPIHIPFEVVGGKRSYLSSAVVYSVGGIAISLVLGLSGGFYAGVLRRRLRLKDGE